MINKSFEALFKCVEIIQILPAVTGLWQSWFHNQLINYAFVDSWNIPDLGEPRPMASPLSKTAASTDQ